MANGINMLGELREASWQAGFRAFSAQHPLEDQHLRNMLEIEQWCLAAQPDTSFGLDCAHVLMKSLDSGRFTAPNLGETKAHR